MADFYEFGSVFWLSLSTLIFGFGSACLAYGLRSKCSHIKLCFGCIDVTRDIGAEVELEETMGQLSLEQPVTTTPPLNRITPPLSRKGSMLFTEIQKELNLRELSNNNV